MSFSRDWLESNPIDHSKFSAIPGAVRQHKVDISDRLKTQLYGFISGETAEGVKHLKVKHQASDPSVSTQQILLYGKDVTIGVNTDTELYLNHETGGVQQITYAGKLWIEALDLESAARGDIVIRDATKFTRLAIGSSGQILQSDGTDPSWADVAKPIGWSYRNLLVQTLSVTQVQITADWVIFEDSSGNTYRASSVNETVAITSSGENGLDTGAEGSSAWYYVWLLRKSSDGTIGAVVSTSSTFAGLSLPTGYDQGALVSAVRNNSSSDFVPFVQRGQDYFYQTPQVMDQSNPGYSSWKSVTTSNYVPNVLSDLINIGFSGTSSFWYTNDNSLSTGETTPAVGKYGNGWTTSTYTGSSHMIQILTSNTVYYLAGASGTQKLICNGFRINKLF